MVASPAKREIERQTERKTKGDLIGQLLVLQVSSASTLTSRQQTGNKEQRHNKSEPGRQETDRQTCTHTCMHTCAHTHTHVRTHIHIHTHTHTCTLKNTCTHTHTHTHTHTFGLSFLSTSTFSIASSVSRPPTSLDNNSNRKNNKNM